MSSRRPVLAIHGGAGVLERTGFDEEAARAALGAALDAGSRVLATGGRALDAVVAAVLSLEDSGQFNAGRGAVRASDGSISLDAAVMDGATRSAGAVASVTGIRNPVLAARAVLERSPHVLLVGPGAEAFAEGAGIPRIGPDYFHPVFGGKAPDVLDAARGKHGTVGAVALDAAGGLAAATSTGGITGKLPGRVGDSPIIGAGTYADDRCAVSATGAGESFLRAVFAHRVAITVAAGQEVGGAATNALAEVTALGGTGGCIALTADGALASPFTTPGMFRGFVDAGGHRVIAIYADEAGR